VRVSRVLNTFSSSTSIAIAIASLWIFTANVNER